MGHDKDFDSVSKESKEISNGSEKSSDDDHLTDRQVMESKCKDRKGCNIKITSYFENRFSHQHYMKRCYNAASM